MRVWKCNNGCAGKEVQWKNAGQTLLDSDTSLTPRWTCRGGSELLPFWDDVSELSKWHSGSGKEVGHHL